MLYWWHIGLRPSSLRLLPLLLLVLLLLLLLLLLLQDPSEDGDEATYLFTAEITEASLSNAALLMQLSPAFTTFAREVNAANSLPDDVSEALPAGISIVRAGKYPCQHTHVILLFHMLHCM
jgi:hypothetical protein